MRCNGVVSTIDRKSMQNQRKANQQSIKNSKKKQSKSRPGGVKSIKNRSKSKPGRGLGGFSLPSVSWEVFWAPLRSGVVANIAPSWLPEPSQNRLRIDTKSDLKIDAYQERFFPRFGSKIWVVFGMETRGKWAS